MSGLPPDERPRPKLDYKTVFEDYREKKEKQVKELTEEKNKIIEEMRKWEKKYDDLMILVMGFKEELDQDDTVIGLEKFNKELERFYG